MKVTADMVYAMSSYLSDTFDDLAPIPNLHKEMWEYCCSDHPTIALAAPRGHAKSSAITFVYLLCTLVFRERTFAVILAETEGKATEFVTTIYDQILKNDRLRKDFGIKGFAKETLGDIVVEFNDGKAFRVMSCGSYGGKVRGAKWVNCRPDIIVGDDLEGDEQVLNQDRREKFSQWFYKAVLPSLARTGVIRVVGTILHLDSLLESFMPERQLKRGMAFRDYIVEEPLSVKSTYKKAVWKGARYRAHDSTYDNLLWPEMFSKERLVEIRGRYVHKGMPEGYSQEYLNYPIDESTAYFKKQDLRAIPDTEYDTQLIYYIGTDFAITEKAKRDFTVFVIIGVTPTSKIQVREVIRERMDGPAIINTMFELQKRYSPEFFTVEKGTLWNALKAYIDKEMIDTGVYLTIMEMAATGEKVARAQAIKTRMRVGMVEFDKEAYWYPALESEFLRFPKDAHDDMVDSLSWLGLALKNLSDAPSQEDIEEEEWEQDWLQSGNMFGGKSMVTGY